MQARIGGRRAAPPRPTLLVGDLAACHAAFERLQQRVLELSIAQKAVVEDVDEAGMQRAAAAWRDLVPRCRALRETLTSLRELSHFTREVYECAADVCVQAGDFPEALKALQTLVSLIYPALATAEAAAKEDAAGAAARQPVVGAHTDNQVCAAQAHQQHHQHQHQHQQQQQQQEGSSRGADQRWQQRQAATSGAWVGRSSSQSSGEAGEGDEEEDGDAWLGAPAAALDDTAVAAALRRPQYRRWPEVAGALALYFTCARPAGAPPGDAQLDTLATLRRLPRPLLAAPEVGAALRLRAALAADDFVAVFRLRAAAPPLVRALADGAAGGGRERALLVLAAAYRNIAVGAVCHMLALSSPRQLLACLKTLADRGHVAVARALSGLQQEEMAALATADVVFKA